MKELADRLVQTVRELYVAGLITPTGGNVSIRLPGGHGFLITPSGMPKGSLCPEDLVHLDPSGHRVLPPDEAVEVPATSASGGGRPGVKPSIETPMHLRIYRLRPTCNAVIHTHAPAATLLGIAGVPIQPVTLDAVRFLGTPLVPFRIPGSKELVDAVEAALSTAPGKQALSSFEPAVSAETAPAETSPAASPSPALLLQNHGLVTFGPSVREAANYALALEEVSRLLLEAQALGRPMALIPAEARDYLRKHMLA